jgi:hypothetical protein
LAKSPQVQKYRPRVEQLVEITGGEKVKNWEPRKLEELSMSILQLLTVMRGVVVWDTNSEQGPYGQKWSRCHRLKLRALHLLGKCSTFEPCPKSFCFFGLLFRQDLKLTFLGLVLNLSLSPSAAWVVGL